MNRFKSQSNNTIKIGFMMGRLIRILKEPTKQKQGPLISNHFDFPIAIVIHDYI